MQIKRKILFINGHLNTGGVERALVDILKHIDTELYSVDLLLLEDTGDYAGELPPYVQVLFKDLHHTYGGLLSSIWKCFMAHDWMCLQLRALFFLRRFIGNKALRPAASILLRNHHYDCVVGFRPGICSDLAAFSVQADKKIIWWHHGVFNADRKAYTGVCAEVDSVVAVSQSCCELLKFEIPGIEHKLVCIPNMLDLRSIWGKALTSPYKKGIFQIVSVGRLAPEKHFENVIPAAKAILAADVDFEWHIVGDGAERQQLEKEIAKNHLKSHVILEGNQPNPYPYIKNADLFVHPSYVESQGIVILEAMALGVPCVVTKSLGPCEFIEDGVNGLLTEQSPESLTEKVLEILRDRALYQRIKENTHCPEQFVPETVMKKIETLLESER